jgi:hypothetical protein
VFHQKNAKTSEILPLRHFALQHLQATYPQPYQVIASDLQSLSPKVDTSLFMA